MRPGGAWSIIAKKGGLSLLELYDLEKLVAVSKAGTLSAAAEDLLISQPALSRSMRKLEAEIGVELFTRSKNRIELNENGALAAQLAENLIGDAQQLSERVRQLDRSRRTISVGSMAPAPMWELASALSDLYPGMAVSTVLGEAGPLVSGLLDGSYSLIILTAPPELPGVEYLGYGGEQLCFHLPISHPLAGAKELGFSDLNGETMLLRSDLGFWTDVLKKMPDTRFIVQHENYAFGELLRASSLPAFNTDRAQRRYGPVEGRVTIPITDPEVSVDYFVAYRAADKKRLESVLKYISGYSRQSATRVRV